MKVLIMVYAMMVHIFFPANERREELNLYRINSAKAESSWKLQTDTGEIILPRNIKDFNENKVNDIFRIGDKVEINLGGNGVLKQEFKGYITSVSADTPVVIKCQDEMWQLKQLPVNVSQKKTTLPKLMSAIASDYTVDAVDMPLGSVRFSKKTISTVLQKLKDGFGLYSYFDGDTLVVGKIYQDNTNEIDIHLEKVFKNNLSYQNKEDVKVLIKAISVDALGNKIEVTVGEKGGTEIQLNPYQVGSESELKQIAEVKLLKYNKAGFKGTVEVLGSMEVKHGDKANIISDLYPERNGQYYIDEVKPKWSDSPEYVKILTIGRKVVV